MSETITITVDGVEVEAKPGQTVIEAADAAGVWIPRLCFIKDLIPHGNCRVCTVMINGRPQAACIQPVMKGMEIVSDTEELNQFRRNVIEMLFVEGNHHCMYCEKSGNCELQALAYRLGIAAPKYPYQCPADREVDLSHPDIMIDRNRCILCARCILASRDLDGKNVYGFVGRSFKKRVAVNAEKKLVETDADVSDRANDVCPVGCIVRKRVGFEVPIGERIYDKQPYGADIEAHRTVTA